MVILCYENVLKYFALQQGSTFYRRSWLQINGVTIQWHAIRFIGIVMTQCTVKKVATTKGYVKPERLPPTTSAVKFHCRRTCLQVMQWMSKSDALNSTEWGWDVQFAKGANWSRSWWTLIPHLINCWKWSTVIALQDVSQGNVVAEEMGWSAQQHADIFVKIWPMSRS